MRWFWMRSIEFGPSCFLSQKLISTHHIQCHLHIKLTRLIFIRSSNRFTDTQRLCTEYTKGTNFTCLFDSVRKSLTKTGYRLTHNGLTINGSCACDVREFRDERWRHGQWVLSFRRVPPTIWPCRLATLSWDPRFRFFCGTLLVTNRQSHQVQRR